MLAIHQREASNARARLTHQAMLKIQAIHLYVLLYCLAVPPGLYQRTSM